MNSKLFSITAVFVTVMFVTVMPAAAQEETTKPDWVLQYVIVCAFLGLTLTILLRPSKRSATAFSTEEQHAQKDEAMKKLKGHK
ncbi:MAG: hypothetical protein LBT89_12140 [Planctomycetaceae bacterium]|jgi:NADH:ubiquinone oxidoreductase subunit 6 (subunit J)|nr:hypothetical protein [Planctomycetaceae bacterium]